MEETLSGRESSMCRHTGLKKHMLWRVKNHEVGAEVCYNWKERKEARKKDHVVNGLISQANKCGFNCLFHCL